MFPGPTVAHGFAMRAVGDGCTIVELDRRLRITKQAAAKSVATLERAGLAARSTSPGDGCVRIVTLTARGVEVRARSAAAFADEVAALRDRVGDDAVDVTVATLAALAATAGHRPGHAAGD